LIWGSKDYFFGLSSFFFFFFLSLSFPFPCSLLAIFSSFPMIFLDEIFYLRASNTQRWDTSRTSNNINYITSTTISDEYA
jgi:hypothetical protein